MSSEIVAHEQPRRAVNLGTLIGPNHRTQALAQRMQRRGEIVRCGRVHYLTNGRVMIQYFRLVPEYQIRRRIMIRTLGLCVSGLVFVGTLATMLWEARFVLLSLVGFSVVSLSLLYLVRAGKHRATCVGLHCPGCRC